MLAVGALAGCGDRPREVSPAPGRLDEATVDMITGSGDYADRHHRVDVAEVELTRRCMRAAGFTWAGAANPANPEAKEGGGVSIDYLRRHGYGLSEESAGTGPEKFGPVVDDTAMRRALLGAEDDLVELRSPAGVRYRYPRQGCAARASIAIYGDLDTWARISYQPQELNLRLGVQAKTDPRYAAKLQEWRDCMAAKHYSYDSPNAIVAGLTEAYRTDRRPLAERRAAEITIAMQDVSCDKQVRLSVTGLAIRRENAQHLDAADRAEMARLSTLFATAERKIG